MSNPLLKATILCYHKVGPHSEEGRRLNIEPARLEDHVRFFRRRRFSFKRVCDLAGPWDRRTVCLTFDDAYVSAMTHGREVLDRHSVNGSFYAVAGLVGGASSWDGQLARPLADWPLLLEAEANGHEIGNHTHTHCDLSPLNEESQAEEFRKAREELLAHGIETFSLCYPYGKHNAATASAATAAGYSLGLILGKRQATEADDKRLLTRIVVAYSDTVPKLLYKIHIRPLLP